MPTDNFNRADNNSLGADWTEDEVSAADLTILSNEMKADDNGGADVALAFWNTDLGGDHFSELEFRSAENSFIQPQSGPAVRIPTSATRTVFSGYVALYDRGVPEISLRKWNAQALTAAGTILGSYAVTLVTGNLIRVEAEGTTIRVKVNGVTQITVTDSTLSGGRPGIVLKEGYIL